MWLINRWRTAFTKECSFPRDLWSLQTQGKDTLLSLTHETMSMPRGMTLDGDIYQNLHTFDPDRYLSGEPYPVGQFGFGRRWEILFRFKSFSIAHACLPEYAPDVISPTQTYGLRLPLFCQDSQFRQRSTYMVRKYYPRKSSNPALARKISFRLSCKCLTYRLTIDIRSRSDAQSSLAWPPWIMRCRIIPERVNTHLRLFLVQQVTTSKKFTPATAGDRDTIRRPRWANYKEGDIIILDE